MRSWGVKGLIFQVSRDSCPYSQWEFDCWIQQVKKILHQAMKKKLRELLNKNPEYTGFQHLTKQMLLLECHAYHEALHTHCVTRHTSLNHGYKRTWIHRPIGCKSPRELFFIILYHNPVSYSCIIINLLQK